MANIKCREERSSLRDAPAARLWAAVAGFALCAAFSAQNGFSQTNSSVGNSPVKATISRATGSGSTLALQVSSTTNVPSEMGGAFMHGSKCDGEGNLYIRKFAADRPLLGPVVKIDAELKRTALFDPAAFSHLTLDRADAFVPDPEGGVYQVAESGVVKPRTYVLHFSPDGSPASSVLLDADFEVYTFAAFADGRILVSGVRRDVENKNDRGQNLTAVFSADGRELAPLSFAGPKGSGKAGGKAKMQNEESKPSPLLDLAEAEAGEDGNLYVMRASSPAQVYVIAPSGEIVKTLEIRAPMLDAVPGGFHVSRNQLAISFWKEDGERQAVVVVDAQTGRKIRSYTDATGVGTSFACFEANEGVFTFLKLGENNELEVVRAEAQ
ncbi:MAG: hypothetical protein ABSD75_01775 [Terriglobales bacterium]